MDRTEDVAIVEESLAERWGELLEPGERIVVEAADTEAGFRAAFRIERPDGEHVTFEAEGSTRDRSGDALRLLVYDALDALLGEWLEGGRTGRLRNVDELRAFDGVPLKVRTARSNPHLESRADALLSGKPRPPTDA